MDLLDRYLESVKKHLPWQRQDDIIAELRANLEAQLEDKEAELGRPLTPVEVDSWLKQLGSPILVAARYQPQRYLIGPNLFPTYWYVTRTALLWAVVIYAIVSASLIATSALHLESVAGALLRLPVLLLQVAAWVTLVFAIIELVGARCPGKLPAFVAPSAEWSPGPLPLSKEGTGGRKKRRTLAHAVAEVIFGFLGLIWLLLVPQHPYLLMGPGAGYLQASPFQLAPVWVQFYWWIVALNVLQLGWRTSALVRGTWQQSRRAESAVVSLIGLVPLCVLLTVRDHLYVTLKHPALDFASQAGNLYSINKSIYGTTVLVLAIAGASLAWEIVRIGLDSYRKRVAAIR